MYQIPTLPLQCDLETKRILKQLNQANRSLAELKGIAPTIPNEGILISTLTLQEARTSSEVEYREVNTIFLDEIEDVEDTPCPTVAIIEWMYTLELVVDDCHLN